MAANARKSKLRRETEKRRTALAESERHLRSEAICSRTLELVRELPFLGSASTVFTYIPFGAEVDIFPLIERLWLQGVPVAAPLTVPQTRQLQLHLIAGQDDLQVGPWGIREPLPGCPLLDDWSQIGCILMPGIAFDAWGGRLGYGGGYYDRFLSKLRQQGQPLPLTVAPAFDLQVVDEVPMEAHDFRVHFVVTENRTIRCG